MKIIKKCHGLPLAAKTLAGLLRCKQDEKDWKDMLNSEIWDLPKEQSRILPALHLSYHYLPAKLKHGFAYCSIFPKAYEFQKEELILLWAAEGFVGGLKRGEAIEEVDETCFGELLSRSFFQQSGRNNSLFVMHDLIHDWHNLYPKNFVFGWKLDSKTMFQRGTRHVAYIREEPDVSKKFDPLCETDKLRTFLPLLMPSEFPTHCYLANEVLHDLLLTFRCLRVLLLSYYNITHSPPFGNLKHEVFQPFLHQDTKFT